MMHATEVNYAPDYLGEQERDMADDNRKRKGIVISLSEAQAKSLDMAAKEAGKNRSEFVRDLLADAIKGFPDDLMAHGEALNKPKDL